MRETLAAGMTILALAWAPIAMAADRVFCRTAETVAVWEFNELPDPGLPAGAIVPDLSGNNLDAVVEYNNGQFVAREGDPNYSGIEFSNDEVGLSQANQAARLVVRESKPFDMDETQDFSVELYVNVENMAGGDWGILAGTWHSRNLIQDTGNTDVDGAWYGYGMIRLPPGAAAGFPNGGWWWVFSPVIDGQPRIGLNPWPEFGGGFFVTPNGRHYIALSVDRTAQLAIVYVDGVETNRLALQPNWAFTTPEGRDPARFRMFAGEDDASRNAYRVAPAGIYLDAVRVQKKALTAGDVFDAWEMIQVAETVGPDCDCLQAIIAAPTLEPVTEQCVLLNGGQSIACEGHTIEKYEWKIGGGAYEIGGATREVSFATPSPAEGSEVRLRVTDDAGATAETSIKLFVRQPAPIAAIAIEWEGEPLPGETVYIAKGETVSLSGEESRTPVPAGLFRCPLDAQDPLGEPPIVAYAWDLDGDGTVDSTASAPPSLSLAAAGERRISLKVTDAAGGTGTATRRIVVSDPRGNKLVFAPADSTIVQLEFNDLGEPGDPILDGDTTEDISGNGLPLTFRDRTGAALRTVQGGLQFDFDNRAAALVGGGNGPRGVIEDDGGAFEMGESQSFTFEIYFKPGPGDTPHWGDVAGTFKARSMDPNPEGQPRYGWGILKTWDDLGYRWLTCHGRDNSEPSVFFAVPKGIFTYVACVVDRESSPQTSTVYVNGEYAGKIDIDPTWSFETPAGMPHASFFLFTREQKTGEFGNIIPGCEVDALRVRSIAMPPDEIADVWACIEQGGCGAPPPTRFIRGDSDGDGLFTLGDGIQILERMFTNRPAFGSACDKAGDTDDDGVFTLADAIRLFNFLFAGGAAPAPPYPACGEDPTGDPLTCVGPVKACP